MTPLERRKHADIASAAGAGILGAGLGALMGEVARPYVVGFIVVGVVLHGLAMVERNLLDADMAIPGWARGLYWACWGFMVALIVWIAVDTLMG